MKRREFFEKTGIGTAGILASGVGLISCKDNVSDEIKLPDQPIDFESIRRDFPALNKFNAYLDTAFVGLVPKQVNLAHHRFLNDRLNWGPFPEHNSILGIWMNKSEEVRVKTARFLGANINEIAFTLCTGCGSNIAINGIKWKKGDNVVIDDLEYPTDFHILNALKKKGVDVRIVRNKNGFISPDNFEEKTDKRTRAYVVSHVSYLNGFRHNLKKLAEIIHSFNGYLIVDGAQSIGGLDINVKYEDVDFMSGIPYKWLNGPNGVGFLYVHERCIPDFEPDRLGWASTNDFISMETMESRPLPDSAKKFEYGTLSFEGIYGLDTVLDYINQIGIDNIEERNLGFVNTIYLALENKGFKFFTPHGNESPILSVYVDNENKLKSDLRDMGVYLTARNLNKGYLRISPHFYNNDNDIDNFLSAFEEINKT